MPRFQSSGTMRRPRAGEDTHYSIMKGSRANLVIRQGAEQNFRPALYVEPVGEVDREAFAQQLQQSFGDTGQKISWPESDR